MIALSIWILSKNNSFNDATKTTLRFIVSVLVMWVCVILFRLLINIVDPILASTEQEQMAVYADGAKNVMALLFGWLYGIVLTIIAWVISRLLLLIRINKNA